MKKIIIFLLLLISFESIGQVKQKPVSYGVQYRRVQADSAIRMPTVTVGIKDLYAGYDTAQFYYNKTDSSVYVYTGSAFRLLRGASGSGSTPTWQQTLIAGSTLTQDNTIINANHELDFASSGIGGSTTLSWDNGTKLNRVVAASTPYIGSYDYIANHLTELDFYPDSAYFLFYNGNLNVPQLRSSTSGNKIWAWDSTNGMVGSVRLGSGLSLSGGVLNTSGTVATPISSLTAATGDNIINNGNYVQHWDWNTFTGDGVNGGLIVSASSTATVGSDPLFNVTVDGALGSGVTSVAAKFNNAHTGTSSSNIAGWFESSGGTNNRAIIVPSGGGNVGIGTSTPAASSLLDITSTSKGFLAPRMTGAQQNAISSPATGLMIYNTDSSAYCYYTGSAWLKISQGGAGGGITSLNGLSGATQTFATGTSGTDFAISSSGTTHTFNIPTASGSNRGLLSTSDWTTFNSKVGGSGTANYVTYWNGTSSVTASDNFRFIDGLYYPTVYIGNSSIFEGALALKQGATSDYSYITGQGGLSFLAPASSKNFNFTANNRQMLRLYDGTTGGTAQFSKTIITVDTAVGGPTLGSIHIEYNAGDSTSISTDVGRHEFRGIGRTYANAGSFNTFYSTVEAGNTTYDQDHIISWQSDAKKTGANTLTYIYHAGFLGDSINAGAVLHRWGVTMFDAVVRSGAILHEQAAIRVPKLRAAKSGQNYFALVDSSDYVQLGGKFSFGSDSSRTQDFNVTGTSYFNGNVGIRQGSPTTALQVAGTFAAEQGADVASANNLAVISNSVEITGTTQINLISNTGWVNGSVIHLIFTSTPTVKNGQTTSGSNIKILLAGAADFSATADDILTLMLCEVGGVQAWREVSRSVN